MQIPKDLIEEALRSLSSIANESDFFKVRSQFLGKKSFIQLSFKKLKNLDPEKKVLAAKELNLLRNQLNNILQDKTALVIAHRLSTINKLDRLVVMENGKVVEMGTHKSLIKKGGHYSKLWSLQSGGFLPTL